MDGAFIENSMHMAGLNRENVTLVLQACHGVEAYFRNTSASIAEKNEKYLAIINGKNVWVDYGASFMGIGNPILRGKVKSHQRTGHPSGAETYERVEVEQVKGKEEYSYHYSGKPGLNRRFTVSAPDSLTILGADLGYMYQGVLNEEAVRIANPLAAAQYTFAPNQKPVGKTDPKISYSYGSAAFVMPILLVGGMIPVPVSPSPGKTRPTIEAGLNAAGLRDEAYKMLRTNAYGLGEDLFRYLVKRSATSLNVIDSAAPGGIFRGDLAKALKKDTGGAFLKTVIESQDYIAKLYLIYKGLEAGGDAAKKATAELYKLRELERQTVITPPPGMKMPKWNEFRRPGVGKQILLDPISSLPATFTQPEQVAKLQVDAEFRLASTVVSTVVDAVAVQAPANPIEEPKELVVVKEPEPNQPPVNDLANPNETKLQKLPNGMVVPTTGNAPLNDLATMIKYDLSNPFTSTGTGGMTMAFA
jgi:hypothetical protein